MCPLYLNVSKTLRSVKFTILLKQNSVQNLSPFLDCDLDKFGHSLTFALAVKPTLVIRRRVPMGPIHSQSRQNPMQPTDKHKTNNLSCLKRLLQL